MVENHGWLSYNELAWVEPLVSPPGDCREEAVTYCRLVQEHARIPVKTMLHLACGAGILDYTFKTHFGVTGVDISPGMLEVARKLNPEVEYHLGDMRCIELGRSFDTVAIPDAIGYMTSEKDLRAALRAAHRHLKVGGVLLLVLHTKEEFKENNFVYTGAGEDTSITVFENNHLPDPQGNTYEATMIYLIRRGGQLELATDCHTIGLFPRKTWMDLMAELGMEVAEARLDHLYDASLLGGGEYPLTVLACIKS
jgi:SAM-dependent methyltransferase